LPRYYLFKMPQETEKDAIMPPDLATEIDGAVQKIPSLGGDRVRFIILYGSVSSGRMKSDSYIDIGVYYDAEGSRFRLNVLSDLFDDIYDIKIFQQLPLPLRMEVLGGEVLYEDGTALCTIMP